MKKPAPLRVITPDGRGVRVKVESDFLDSKHRMVFWVVNVDDVGRRKFLATQCSKLTLKQWMFHDHGMARSGWARVIATQFIIALFPLVGYLTGFGGQGFWFWVPFEAIWFGMHIRNYYRGS